MTGWTEAQKLRYAQVIRDHERGHREMREKLRISNHGIGKTYAMEQHAKDIGMTMETMSIGSVPAPRNWKKVSDDMDSNEPLVIAFDRGTLSHLDAEAWAEGQWPQLFSEDTGHLEMCSDGIMDEFGVALNGDEDEDEFRVAKSFKLSIYEYNNNRSWVLKSIIFMVCNDGRIMVNNFENSDNTYEVMDLPSHVGDALIESFGLVYGQRYVAHMQNVEWVTRPDPKRIIKQTEYMQFKVEMEYTEGDWTEESARNHIIDVMVEARIKLDEKSMVKSAHFIAPRDADGNHLDKRYPIHSGMVILSKQPYSEGNT